MNKPAVAGDMREPVSRKPLLSICIPTYNRAACLQDCLESLYRATATCRDLIEIIVSDNASTDNTADIVAAQTGRLPIRYFKNPSNIGGERNFFAAANHSAAEFIWIFGDDDEFGELAVLESLRYIRLGYDLILANFSSWSKDMGRSISGAVLSTKFLSEYEDKDIILSTFGILLGYISSIVVRREILFSTPAAEYEVFVQYGFPFPYCIYSGLRAGSRMAYNSQPIFKRREDNSDFSGAYMMWVKFFIEGPALVFEALQTKGYSADAVRRAKGSTLRDFGVGNILAGIGAMDRPEVRSMMNRHYRSNWRYWTTWLPLLSLPSRVVQIAYRAYRLILRRGRK